jgi:hypothetical protein
VDPRLSGSQPSQRWCRPQAPTSGRFEGVGHSDGATKIARGPLESGEVGLPWGVHVNAHLLDGVGDVRLGEGQVLESVVEAPLGHRVGD